MHLKNESVTFVSGAPCKSRFSQDQKSKRGSVTVFRFWVSSEKYFETSKTLLHFGTTGPTSRLESHSCGLGSQSRPWGLYEFGFIVPLK